MIGLHYLQIIMNIVKSYHTVGLVASIHVALTRTPLDVVVAIVYFILAFLDWTSCSALDILLALTSVSDRLRLV